MSRSGKYIRLFLLLGILLVFTLGFRAFALPYIVEPIATLLWAGWRVVLSVDQDVYWGLLIFLCALLVIRMFASAKSGPPTPESTDRHAPRTRVERWQALLEDARSGGNQKAALRDAFRALLVSIIEQTEPSPPANVAKALASQEIALPAALHQYLFPRRSGGWTFNGQGLNLPGPAPQWLRRWLRIRTDPEPDTTEELVQWMESLMEITHDRSE